MLLAREEVADLCHSVLQWLRAAARSDSNALELGSGLPGRRLPALAAGGLLLRGGAALLRAPAGPGGPAPAARRARRVGDPGRPLLRHPLVLEGLVLLLILHAVPL